MNEFVHEYCNTINKCGYKNAFGCFIAMCIYIDGKKDSICKEGNATDRC